MSTLSPGAILPNDYYIAKALDTGLIRALHGLELRNIKCLGSVAGRITLLPEEVVHDVLPGNSRRMKKHLRSTSSYALSRAGLS